MSHNSIIRKIIVKLHLYTGLILGLIITLICLSGTAIVYKPELEKLSVKDIAFVKPASRTVSPQTLLENVRHEYPQAKINNMVLYGGEDCAYSFRTTFPDEKGRIQIYVNPYTGEVTGVDRYRHKVFQWLYDFHVNLLLKKQGATIVALSGFLLIFLTLSGFLLLPKRRIFSVNRKMGLRAKLFKSHSIIGICTSLFLLVIMLLLLVFVMKGFGSFFTHQRKKQSPSQTELDEETVAAIMTALKLFGSARHDRETEMLTILSIKRAYSPWNSKIHGLTQMPDYRK